MENWKPVPIDEYRDKYSISDCGRVRSEDRIVRHINEGRKLKSQIIRARISPVGYPIVNLCANNRRKTFQVHALVALTFIGPRPKGQEVRHLDGNRKNPNVSNLAYGTRQDNVNDAIGHGTIAKGEKISKSGIKATDIPKIRSDKRMLKEIAADYKVGIPAISNIKNMITWRHVK